MQFQLYNHNMTLKDKMKIWLSVLYFIFSQIIGFLLSNFIQAAYPERLIVPDLLFDLVPEILWFEYFSEPLIFGSIGILLYYVFSPDRKNIPFHFTAVGSVYLLRALLMVLTPLGRPTGNDTSFGILKVIGFMQHGMFPSGHVALSFLVFLVISKKTHKSLRIIAGVLCFFQIIVLIPSRGHYSIDIAGGLFVSWTVWSILTYTKTGRRLLAD